MVPNTLAGGAGGGNEPPRLGARRESAAKGRRSRRKAEARRAAARWPAEPPAPQGPARVGGMRVALPREGQEADCQGCRPECGLVRWSAVRPVGAAATDRTPDRTAGGGWVGCVRPAEPVGLRELDSGWTPGRLAVGHRQTRRGCRPADRHAAAVAGWVGCGPFSAVRREHPGALRCLLARQDAAGARQRVGRNRNQGRKGFGGAPHLLKNRVKTNDACQVKGDICQRQITSPKRSEKAPQNSGTSGMREKYQIAYTKIQTDNSHNSHGGLMTPCSSSPWWW